MILFITVWGSFAADCAFNGDIVTSFNGCNPSTGIINTSDPDLQVTKVNSDFRQLVASVIRRVQIVMAIVAVGLIVWLGLLMVLPTSAETKESTKGKFISITVGFLFMIGATILVEWLINLIYALFQ